MTYDALNPRSVTLRLEFSIADAVAQRGLAPVMLAAIRAWWSRPRLPPDLPAYLREDVGLPAEAVSWLDLPTRANAVALWRPGL